MAEPGQTPSRVALSPVLTIPPCHLPSVIVVVKQLMSPEHIAGTVPPSLLAFVITVPLRSIFRRCFLIPSSHEVLIPWRSCVSLCFCALGTESRISAPVLAPRQIPSLWGRQRPTENVCATSRSSGRRDRQAHLARSLRLRGPRALGRGGAGTARAHHMAGPHDDADVHPIQ